MAKLKYTIAELLADTWTQEDLDAAVSTSRFFKDALGRGWSVEQVLPLALWDDYNDKFEWDRTAYASFEATAFTGREAQDIEYASLETAPIDYKFLFYRAAKDGGVIEVVSGAFRAGDRIIVREDDLLVEESKTYKARPGTIKIVEAYTDSLKSVTTRAGVEYRSIRARYVVEETVAQLSDKDRAFAEASTDDRRKSTQLDAATEARKAAKALGGNALTGTAPQKKWAETIRKDALSKASPEVAEKLLKGKKFQTAKWWIENRKALDAVWLAKQVA